MLERFPPFNNRSRHRGNLKSHLMLLSKTADSISDGDLVDRRIRSGQNWSLLPTQVRNPHNISEDALTFVAPLNYNDYFHGDVCLCAGRPSTPVCCLGSSCEDT